MDFFKLYGAGQLPTFSESPIWLLGQCFKSEKPTDASTATPCFKSFLDAFANLLWFTYRKDFPVIENTAYTSDAGWGCMLRTGQMVLGQALIASTGNKEGKKESLIPQIVRWFSDTPKGAPYSIHTIAKAGEKYGKNIGEWFGPSTIANVLCELVTAHKPSNLSIYVSDDGAVYIDTAMKLATGGDSNTWKPLLVVIPLRLGLDSMNEIYYPAILETFKFKQSLGILGGKPRASLYFVAAQDDSVFYLDPHALQATVNSEGDFKVDSFHCAFPKKTHVSEIDPSLALAFYCSSKADFDDFCSKSNELSAKHKDAELYTISSHAPDYKGGSSLLLDDEDEEDIELDMDMVVL